MGKKENPKGGRRGMAELSSLTEDERRALRGSKFASLPCNHSSSSLSHQQGHQPRLAHPGGPLTTNKAAALAKFLERKLQQPGGLESIKPELLELAVKNAKEAVNAGGSSGSIVHHVTTFDDSPEDFLEDRGSDEQTVSESKSKKKKKRKHENSLEKSKSKKKKKKKKAESPKKQKKKSKR